MSVNWTSSISPYGRDCLSPEWVRWNVAQTDSEGVVLGNNRAFHVHSRTGVLETSEMDLYKKTVNSLQASFLKRVVFYEKNFRFSLYRFSFYCCGP